ncbi:TPA: hypothetical protein ACUFFK_004499 [Escherichia coli]
MNIYDLLKDAAIKHGYTRGQCGIDNMRIAKAAKVSSDDVKTLLGTLKRKMPPLMVLAKVAALLHVDSEIMDYLVAGSLQNVTPDNHQPDSCGSGDSVIKPAVTAKPRKKKTAFDTRKYTCNILLRRLRQHGAFTGTKAELIALLTNGKNDISEPTLRRYLAELKREGLIRYIVTIGKVEISFPGQVPDNGKDYGYLYVQQRKDRANFYRSLR